VSTSLSKSQRAGGWLRSALIKRGSPTAYVKQPPAYAKVPGVRRLQDRLLEEPGSAFRLRCIVSFLRPAVSLLRLHGGWAAQLKLNWPINQPVSSKSPTTSS